MMKKLLLFSAVFLFGTASMFAQFANIGILGGSTSTDWDSDTNMVTTDGIIYTLNNFVLENPVSTPPDAGVKFRQDDDWALNWGGSGFPSGTASLNGPNISVVNGTYDVTFNLNTLQYTFAASGYDEVMIMGVTMFTPDGIHYSAKNVTFEGGNFSFMLEGDMQGWGSASFPSGTATQGGAEIPVAANSYNITFNKETGDYSFDYVIVGLIGPGALGWNTDAVMMTADGVNYTLDDYTLTADYVKFRMNNAWDVNWGSGIWPSGTATQEGADILAEAGTYDIAFNRVTGDYSFTSSTAGINDFSAATITVYPNPSQNAWNFNAGNTAISALQIVDTTGKVVYNATVNAAQTTVNASGFASGMYFARLTSGNATETVRVIKN